MEYAKEELQNKPKSQQDLFNGGAVLEMLNKYAPYVVKYSNSVLLPLYIDQYTCSDYRSYGSAQFNWSTIKQKFEILCTALMKTIQNNEEENEMNS